MSVRADVSLRCRVSARVRVRDRDRDRISVSSSDRVRTLMTRAASSFATSANGLRPDNTCQHTNAKAYMSVLREALATSALLWLRLELDTS